MPPPAALRAIAEASLGVLIQGRPPKAAYAPPQAGEVKGRRSALLLGDDLVLDLVVCRLRDDALLHQFVLALVGTALDDRSRVSLADARQRFVLFGARRVYIEQ